MYIHYTISPKACLEEAIRRSIGWISEDEMRDLVEKYTGCKLTLSQANNLGHDIADAMIARMLKP